MISSQLYTHFRMICWTLNDLLVVSITIINNFMIAILLILRYHYHCHHLENEIISFRLQVLKINEIGLPSDIRFKETKDHAKWAVTTSKVSEQMDTPGKDQVSFLIMACDPRHVTQVILLNVNKFKLRPSFLNVTKLCQIFNHLNRFTFLLQNRIKTV